MGTWLSVARVTFWVWVRVRLGVRGPGQVRRFWERGLLDR
nr:MAG TPA: hypothetical protein [Caudoviricetes sp.]